MVTRSLLLALALFVSAPAWAASPPPAARAAESEADRLLADADRRLTRHTFYARRIAIYDLEQACDLVPERADIQLRLARTYADAGFTKQSRLRYERALLIAPDNADARMGLGQAWRRDWLKYLERRSLDRAIEHFSACARLDPKRTDAWLMLSALLVERGDLTAARSASDHALEFDRSRADCQLAGASLRWRQGDVPGADSLFRL